MINKVILGDCLEIMRDIPENSVDVIFTSPPYADRRKNTYGGIKAEEYIEWFIPIAKEYKRILKENGSLFINIKPHCDKGERNLYVYELVIALKRIVGFRFSDEYCWIKNGVPGKFKGRFKNGFEPIYHFTKNSDYTFNPYDVSKELKEDSVKRASRKASGMSKNGSGFAGMRKNETMQNLKRALPSNVINANQKSNQYSIESKHPAVFPLELVDFFIKAFSNEGDIVLDNFSGSGTTCVSALKNKRNFIGIEKEKEYVNISLERINAVKRSEEENQYKVVE